MLRIICAACLGGTIIAALTGCGAGEVEAAAQRGASTTSSHGAPSRSTPPPDPAQERARAIRAARGTQPIATFHPDTTAKEQRAEFRKFVGKLLHHRQYDQLEGMWRTLNDLKPRDNAGVWRLGVFYSGLEKGSERAQSTITHKETYRRLMDDWKQAHPDSIAQRVAEARAYKAWAWEARGKGFSNTVSEANWREFRPLLEQAWTILEEIEDQAITDPVYYETKLSIGIACQPKSKLYEIIEQGSTVEPRYHPIYNTMAFALLPRWHGYPGEVELFATTVADRLGKYDGDAMYARIAADVWWASGSGFFEKHDFDWERISRGYAFIIDVYPEGYTNSYCRLAVTARDRKTARPLFDELGEWSEDKKHVWRSKEKYERSRAWAFSTDDGPDPSSEALLAAVIDRDLETISQLLQAGADINARNHDGYTPLMLAIANFEFDALELILAHDPDINLGTHGGKTPMMFAAERGLTSVVGYLLKRGAPVNSADDWGWTSLHRAASKGFEGMAGLLLAQPGIDVNARTTDGDTPLNKAAATGRHEVAALLLQHPDIDVDNRDHDGFTSLQLAALNGYTDLARALIAGGADIHARTKIENTPLHLAAMHDHYWVAASLLTADGIDINARDIDGWTPLMKAIDSAALQVTDLLLRHGVDVKASNANGWTALHEAASKGDSQLVQHLLDAGADINAQAMTAGNTPLKVALITTNTEVADLLRAAGGEE